MEDKIYTNESEYLQEFLDEAVASGIIQKGQDGQPGEKGEKGEKGDNGEKGNKGDKGDTTVLEKIIEIRTEIIKELPIITNEIKEVAIKENPEQIVGKVNISKVLIEPTQVRGLDNIRQMAAANAVPVTTSFFNGLRAKNLNITGGTTTQNGDTVTVAITGGGGSSTPAGSNTQIQYNNSGAFGASSNFTYDGTYLTVLTPGVSKTYIGNNNIAYSSEKAPALDSSHYTTGTGWSFAGGQLIKGTGLGNCFPTTPLTVVAGTRYEIAISYVAGGSEVTVTGTVTNGSTTVTGISDMTDLTPGYSVFLTTGIQAGTVIVSVNVGASSLVMSKPATATATGVMSFQIPPILVTIGGGVGSQTLGGGGIGTLTQTITATNTTNFILQSQSYFGTCTITAISIKAVSGSGAGGNFGTVVGGSNTILATSSSLVLMGNSNTISGFSVGTNIFGSGNTSTGASSSLIYGTSNELTATGYIFGYNNSSSGSGAFLVGTGLTNSTSSIMKFGLSDTYSMTLGATGTLTIPTGNLVITAGSLTTGGSGSIGSVLDVLGDSLSVAGTMYLSGSGGLNINSAFYVYNGGLVNFQSAGGGSASPTGGPVTTTDYIGYNNAIMTDPGDWLLIQKGGTDWLIPLYVPYVP